MTHILLSSQLYLLPGTSVFLHLYPLPITIPPFSSFRRSNDLVAKLPPKTQNARHVPFLPPPATGAQGNNMGARYPPSCSQRTHLQYLPSDIQLQTDRGNLLIIPGFP